MESKGSIKKEERNEGWKNKVGVAKKNPKDRKI